MPARSSVKLSPPSPLPSNTGGRWWLVALVLAAHYIVGLSATLDKCTTFDEILHITGGCSYALFGDFRLQPENGWLPQRWAALGASRAVSTFPPREGPAWELADAAGVGQQLFYESGNDADQLLLRGRAMIGLWSVALGGLMYAWNRHLSGAPAAWLTLMVWAVCPSFLAHGFLTTSDQVAACLFLATFGALWRAVHRLTWSALAFLTMSTAGLFLAKFSAPLVIPLGGLLGLLRLAVSRPWEVRLYGPPRVLTHRSAQALAMAALAGWLAATTAFAIWAAYGFRYSARATAAAAAQPLPLWNDLLSAEQPSWLTSALTVCRDERLLPEAYLYGFAHTNRFAQQRRAFFFGEFSLSGWRLFFPYCVAAKTPTGTWLLVLLAGYGGWCLVHDLPAGERAARIAAQLYHAAPLVVLFVGYWLVLVSSTLNIGLRHALPTLPPLLMWAGLASVGWQRRPVVESRNVTAPSVSLIGRGWAAWRARFRWPLFALLVTSSVTLAVAESLARWPNYVAFFNVPSGGPATAWSRLVDSSLDWGQELPALRHWLDNERLATTTPVYLSYFGTGDPGYYGLRLRLLPGFFDRRPMSFPEPLEPGVYCISATMLAAIYTDFPGPWTDEHEQLYRTERQEIERFAAERRQPEFPARWEALPESQRQSWLLLFRQFEQLRFVRLTHALRRRAPDEQVNYGLLIYRINAAELDQALNEPLP